MRAGAHARTIFAGFGVTGSLLAAVGATFVVAGGVLAFDQWPASLADPPASLIAVAPLPGSESGSPSAPESVALPPAVAVAATPGGTVAVSDTGRDNRGRSEEPTVPRGKPTDPATPQTPTATPPATPIGGDDGGEPTQPDNPLAVAVGATTGATADGVRSVGTALPLTAPITELVGGLVDTTGATVSGLLNGLGGPRG